jgi:hypothetical protein
VSTKAGGLQRDPPDTLAVIVAATAAIAGVIAAAAAVGWIAVTSTDPYRSWRELEGTFAGLSISFAVVTVVLGIIALGTNERRPRRAAFAVTGLALGAITLGFWVWLVRRLGG